MSAPDVIGPSCNDPQCPRPSVIAGWCPGHAIARYRRFVMRELPERYESPPRKRAEDEE
ncbi:hypothetical protein ACFW08_05990 [Streptomyces sp. NPDC058960]|uniref:hypothetical protein n=1 Tax=Streptomyces sp. NPDC058960 TaxID=3346679 RepID=UPI0036A12033